MFSLCEQFVMLHMISPVTWVLVKWVMNTCIECSIVKKNIFRTWYTIKTQNVSLLKPSKKIISNVLNLILYNVIESNNIPTHSLERIILLWPGYTGLDDNLHLYDRTFYLAKTWFSFSKILTQVSLPILPINTCLT